jgi:hypothetical protein
MVLKKALVRAQPKELEMGTGKEQQKEQEKVTPMALETVPQKAQHWGKSSLPQRNRPKMTQFPGERHFLLAQRHWTEMRAKLVCSPHTTSSCSISIWFLPIANTNFVNTKFLQTKLSIS